MFPSQEYFLHALSQPRRRGEADDAAAMANPTSAGRQVGHIFIPSDRTRTVTCFGVHAKTVGALFHPTTSPNRRMHTLPIGGGGGRAW